MYKRYLLYCYHSVLFNWCLKDKNTQKDVTEKGCPSLMYKCFNVSLCTRFIVMWLLCGFIRVEISDERVVLVSWAWRSLISQCRKWLRHMTDESAKPGYRHSNLSWDYWEEREPLFQIAHMLGLIIPFSLHIIAVDVERYTCMMYAHFGT